MDILGRFVTPMEELGWLVALRRIRIGGFLVLNYLGDSWLPYVVEDTYEFCRYQRH